MKIGVIDFEKLTSHFIKYREGIQSINGKKDQFLSSIDPIKKEMNSIISAASSKLLLDNRNQQEKTERFELLKKNIIEMESLFRQELKEFTNNLNIETYTQLSEIVTEWGDSNDMDLIISKMEVVYMNNKIDITDNIISILRDKDLFIE